MAIEIIDKIKQKNGGTFKLMDAEDIAFEEHSLTEEIDSVKTQLSELDNTKLNKDEQNSISMGMLTQEVKKSMTNGNVAVVGVDSVGYVQLTQDIQNDITEMVNIVESYNDYNADISGNKVIIISSNWYKHQIFNVSEGERYDVTVDTMDNTSTKYCIFSNDNLDVVGYSITGIDSSQKITETIVVPSGASKMYINTKNDGVINVNKYTYSKIATKNELKRVESATNEANNKISEANNKISEANNKISNAENKINKINNELKGLKELVILPYENQDKAYDNIDGVAQQSGSIYYKSIICDCSELNSVYVNFKTSDNVRMYYIHFITDDFTVISSLCDNYGQSTVVKDLELEVPVGATKVIVNTIKEYDCSCKKEAFKNSMKVGVDSVGYVNLTQDIQNDITEMVNIVKTYNDYNADISNNKVIITSSNWYKHQIFNVSEGERYDVTVDTLNNTSTKYCIFSNDNLDVVGYSITGIDSSQKITETIVVPSGASKMYINTKNDGVINVNKYTYSKIATKNELKRVESATNEANNKISNAENKINKINNELKGLKELVILPYENQDKAYDNINGVAQQSGSIYYKSIICDCSELDSVYVNFITSDNVRVYYIHFIADDFTVISSLCDNYGQSTVVKDLELKVPVGATKVIVNTVKEYDCSCKKEAFKNILTESDMFMLNEMNVPYVQGERYIIENGKAVKDLSDPAQGYTATIIDVKETEKYYVTLKWTYSSYNAVIFTDVNNNVLSTSLSGTGSTVRYRDVELIVPTGAVKMIVHNEHSINPPIIKKYGFKYGSKELTIPPYSVNYLEQKISLINDYEYKIGSDGDSFIFVTDIHIDDNRLISASLIDEIISKTNIKKVIFGGDLIKNSANSEKEIIEFCRLFKEKYGHHRLYSVMGNHDLLGYNSDTHSAQYVQSDSMRYGLLGKMQEDYCTFGSNKGFYYYFDNKNQKIRYICLNLFENTESNKGSIYVSDEQIQWLKSEAISGLTSEWEIVIVSHTGLTLKTFPLGADNNYIKKVKTAVDEINDTYNVICCLSGHMHKDLNEFNSNTMHISFACDASYPDDGIQRTRGTNNEYCFDVVCIDKTNRKINCVRIGAGDNREFNY